MGEADFERIRDRAKAALTLELRGNDDEELGKELLQAMLYEGHPYGHPELGTERSLAAMTLADVRAQHEAVLCGPRATVALAGDYPEDFEGRVTEDLMAIRSDSCLGRLDLPAPATLEGPRVWVIDKPEAQAVAVSMGMHLGVTREHEDYPAMVLAAAYLGQHRQFIGRLMQRIREHRGINYGDYCYAEHFEQDGWGVFPLANTARRQQYFSIWLRPVRPEQVHFAIRLAVMELRGLVEDGMSQEDFERVRDYIGGYYALYLQTESRRIGFSVDDSFYGVGAPYLERLRRAFASLDAEAVNAAVRRHLDPSQLQIAVVSDSAEDLVEALASEEPSPIEYAAEVPSEITAEDRDIVEYRLGIPRESIRVIPLAEVFR